MRHIIAILLQNEAGALSRVAGLFSTRGYNIESLSVAPTDDSTVSRLTLVTTGSEAVIQQIVNQLNKLVDVVSVEDMTTGEHLERELILLKLRVRPEETDALRGYVVRTGGRVRFHRRAYRQRGGNRQLHHRSRAWRGASRGRAQRRSRDRAQCAPAAGRALTPAPARACQNSAVRVRELCEAALLRRSHGF
jgi:acetolactate synthase small subunit